MKAIKTTILLLLLSTSAFAGIKGSIGADYSADHTRYTDTVTETYSINNSVRTRTYNVDRIEKDSSVDLRLLFGYDLELTDLVDIGFATSYSTNNTVRHDLIAKFKPQDSAVNLKIGPSVTTFLKSNNYKQAVGLNFGSEINLSKKAYIDLNMNVSQFQGPQTTLHGTLTTGIGFRF